MEDHAGVGCTDLHDGRFYAEIPKSYKPATEIQPHNKRVLSYNEYG